MLTFRKSQGKPPWFIKDDTALISSATNATKIVVFHHYFLGLWRLFMSLITSNPFISHLFSFFFLSHLKTGAPAYAKASAWQAN
jgi:hypothetical protein